MGAYFAFQFLKAGHNVSIIGKRHSEHLEQILQSGLRLHTSDGPVHLACDQFSYIGDADSFPKDKKQDLVIICVKQYDMTVDIAEMAVQITGEHSVIGVITNGLPFYFTRKLNLASIDSVDPRGAILEVFKNKIIMGIQPVIASQMISPGVIEIRRPLNAISVCLGSPEEKTSAQITQINMLFNASGIKATYLASGLRKNILEKLQFALSINTLSALLEQNLGTVFDETQAQSFISYVIELINQMAIALEIKDLRTYIQFKALTITREHYSSLYHDIKAGKPGEINAIIGSSMELAIQLQQARLMPDTDLEPLEWLRDSLYRKSKKEEIPQSEIESFFRHCQDVVDMWNRVQALTVTY